MEWYIILAIIVIIILIIILGILLGCILKGQACTVSIEKRKPNEELTRIQQEQERKQEKKFSSKIKRAFRSSSKRQQPLVPVEDVQTVQFTLKLSDDQNDSEQITTINEPLMILPSKVRSKQIQRDKRHEKLEKKIRQKYNI